MKRRWTISRITPIVVVAVATLVTNTLPAIAGVLARQLGFEPGALGAFGSADQLGMALGALAAISLMRYCSARATVVTGLTLLLAANFGSSFYGSASAIVTLRAGGGFGTGLTVSACYYIFSLEDQERNAAASMLAQTALAFIVITAIPRLTHAFGWSSVFIGLGLLVIPCLLAARSLRPGYKEPNKPNLSRTLAGPASAAIWLGLISSALFNVAVGAFWTYLERIGAAIGVAEESVSNGLSIATVMGLVGSILVLALGEGINGAILVASVVLNILGIAASSIPIPWVYMAAISVFYASLPIYFSAQFSAVMRLGSSSRLAGQFTLSLYFYALGPILGGIIAERYGILAVRWLAATLTAVSAALFWVGFFSSYSPSRRANDGVPDGGPAMPASSERH
jgi:predicted MFS family arabinose efflux permease